MMRKLMIVTAVAAAMATTSAQALTHLQIVQTCQIKRDIARTMMKARQAGVDKADLEDRASNTPPIAGETGLQLLDRVYRRPIAPEGQRAYTVAIFAAGVYTECNEALSANQ